MPLVTATSLADPAGCSAIATAWIWAICPAPIIPNPTVISSLLMVWIVDNIRLGMDDRNNVMTRAE